MPPKAKVMVIDDNVDSVEVMRFALADNNYDIVACYSGEQCLAQIEAEEPDCIILDVMMPGINGFEVCEKLKKEMGLKTPIVVISAKSGKKDIDHAKSLGADDYLVKPVSNKKLLEAIETAIAMGARETGTVGEPVSCDILLVTDNSVIIEEIRRMLFGPSGEEPRHYRLIEAQSLRHAERITKARPPAILIADGNLHANDAPELCRSVKADPKRKHIPIIAIVPDPEDEFKYAWADERLAEPIDYAQLHDCIKQYITQE